MIKKLVLIWMLLATFLLAQKVTQLKFVGLAHLSNSTAKEISGVHVGDQITAELINESIKNFFSQGYFKDVWVDQKSGVLIYHFDEKLAIANVSIKGYGSGDDGKKLLAGIGVKKGDLYDARRIRKAKNTMIAKLESQGYYDTVVETSTKAVGKTSMSVTFDVNKGEKIVIEKMNFVGAKELSQSDLQKELANKEADWLGWMPWRNSGEAAVDQLKYDNHRIKNTYMEHGYLDAKVSPPLMRVDFGSYKGEVDYQIVEGGQYTIGKITITHDIEGLKNKDLKEGLILHEGKIFNIKRMRKDIKKLEEEVGNFGFAYVKVAPQMNKNPETKTLNLNYIVTPGEPVTIKDVIISGNDITKDRVIRRYIYLAPGDKFNAKDLKDSKSALGRTGFFEKVDIESERISKDEINLLVKVKETSTGSISAGGGYGSYEGLMVNASISDRNIFGSGINTTLGFEISKISKNYNISFTNPRIWDSKYSTSLSFYKRDYEFIDYSQDQLGANFSVGREFYRYFHASVGLGYVDNQSTINNIDNGLGNVNNILYNDQYSKTSLVAGLNFNNTDDFYQPREGMQANIGFEYGQLDGTSPATVLGTGVNAITTPAFDYEDIIKGTGKLGLYYGLEDLINYDMILRFKGRVTYINSNDDLKVPTAERLFMGGVGSVRGYNPYSLAPYLLTKDSAGNEVRSLVGGTQRVSTSFEASVPLSEAAKMRLAFFYDYGMIAIDRKRDDTGNLLVDSVARSSAGVVLEWQSSFGPINLVFAYPIDEQEGDQTAVFEFSMGSRF